MDVHPVDAMLPPRRLLAFGLQHLLVMIASPITAVFVVSRALAIGVLPILVPGLYGRFPTRLQIILGNGLAIGTLTAVLFNILFHHWGRPVRRPADATAYETA